MGDSVFPRLSYNDDDVEGDDNEENDEKDTEVQTRDRDRDIPHICHESHENSRVNFFWPV